MSKLLKKVSAMTLAFLIAFTGIPGIGLSEAYAGNPEKGDSGKWVEGTAFKDSENREYAYPGSEMRYMEITYPDYNSMSLKKGSAIEIQKLRRYRLKSGSDTYVAYCLEHGVVTDTAAQLKAVRLNKSYIDQIYKNEGKEYILANMGLALFYGRQNESSIYDLLNSPEEGGLGFRESKYYDSSAHYRLDDWEAATRQLIHESQQDFRDKEFNKKSNGLRYQSGWRGTPQDKISTSHYYSPLSGQPAQDIYNYMALLIKNHRKYQKNVVSDNKGKPKEIKLSDEDGDGTWTARIPVTISNACSYKVVKDGNNPEKVIDGVTLKIVEDGGKKYYEFRCEGEPDTAKIYTAFKMIQGRSDISNMLVWECKDGAGHVQSLATGYADPVPFFFKFTKDTPVPEGEEPEPEYFPSFEFPVHKDDLNPGWDGDKCTPMGDATLAGTYVLYRDGTEVDRVTLSEYGETKTLVDQPWETPGDLIRTENGSYNHVETDGEGNVTHSCTVAPTEIKWTGTHTYTIKEIRPDGRFIEPDAYNGRREYTVSYYAETYNAQTCVNNPPAWSEIQYKVNLNTVTGDGGNAAEGLDVKDNLSEIITLPNQETFINDCYRGKVTISKSLEREDPFKDNPMGGHPDSVRSQWKMYLQSGGYENHKYIRFVREADLVDGTSVYRCVRDTSGISNAGENLVIGTNGDMVIYDIPYGRYWVEEVVTDDASYVKEKFEVTIDEHGGTYTPDKTYDNRYDYNLRDKKKTNVIKVIKTDGETGKLVSADENERNAKFYIRYKGNPDNTDAQNRALADYNRFLPNAPSITADGPFEFEANRNGEIVIDYELPYGIYEILEWTLPEGYFVGEYDETGTSISHDYGKVEEGQRKALSGSEWSDLVTIYNAEGEKVSYKDASEYTVDQVFNSYTFEVTRQQLHTDGNFGQLVTYDGDISAADKSYNSKLYPYTAYYKAVAIANNQVKGKIEIEKTGEILSGFIKETVLGHRVFKPVYGVYEALKGAVFGIFAAADELLKDGNDGPAIYDASTNEVIDITKNKSTHFGNLTETITGLLGKLFGTAETYETGTYDHESGAKFWYFKDRESGHAGIDGEDNHYTRMYVSPEQKDTTYSYTYETGDGEYSYRYDVAVTMNYQAGGKNITDVNVIKTTTAGDGYKEVIPLTLPEGSVGDNILSPIENYLGMASPDDTTKTSRLTVTDKTYIYEADGEVAPDWDGNMTDFAAIGVRRYEVRDDIPVEEQFTIPEGWTAVPYIGDPQSDTHYALITKDGAYKVLLDDGLTWQDCDSVGNFQKMTVQVYKTSFVQEPETDDGFTFSWDGFEVAAKAEYTAKNAVTVITKQADSIAAVKDVGAGFTYTDEGRNTIFTAEEPAAPVYFLSRDGVKTEMYYAGGVMKATIEIPQAAVESDYEHIVPVLNFRRMEEGGAEDNILDWYSKLTPSNPVETFEPAIGISVKITRVASNIAGQAEKYVIEIISNQGEDAPMVITFADGYSMTMYADTSASGNGVGVIILDSIYKTTRYTMSELVETITTDDEGKAVSSPLPLGTYIIRELKAPSGYVTDDKDYLAELKYKDQFTPLVWQILKNKNEYFSVEIDLSKVFETAYKSGVFTANGGAIFGLYSADPIDSGRKDAGNIKGKIPADTLLDVISVGADGKAKSTIKLPYGTYYIKELTTLSTHKKDDKPYYFVVKETDTDQSSPCEFSYESDGISGNVVLDKYGQADITVKTLTRYPMLSLTVDGKAVGLTEDMSDSSLKVTIAEDAAIAKITAKDNVPVNITLPNGKTLTVVVKGNIYEYTLDGVTQVYTPDVSYTGYFASYEHEFTADTKPDFSDEVETVEFKGAGTDASTIKAEIIHTPITTPEPALKDGKQVYTHTSSFTVTDAMGSSTIDGSIIRKRGDLQTIETAADTVLMEAGDIITLSDLNGAQISILLDETGKFKAQIHGTLPDMISEAESPKVLLNGSDAAGMEYVKSVTLARQDHSAKTLQIKINTIDNLNASPIENDHLKTDTTTPTPNPGKGNIIITKVDGKTDKALLGAIFEIWSSKTEGEGSSAKTVPDKMIHKGTTGADGRLSLSLDYGTYFYREKEAPEGYVLDNNFYEIRVSSLMPAQVTVTNEKEDTEEPEKPEKPDKPKPTKPEKPQKPSEVPKTGDTSEILFYMILAAVALTLMTLAAFRRCENEEGGNQKDEL